MKWQTMMSVMELYIITSLSLPKLHKVVTSFWISNLWNSLWLHPTTGGDVPPWFAEALCQALESIAKLWNPLIRRSTNSQTTWMWMRKPINLQMSQTIYSTTIIFNLIYTQLYNRSRGSGNDTALEVVLFENGNDPTKPPVWSAFSIWQCTDHAY